MGKYDRDIPQYKEKYERLYEETKKEGNESAEYSIWSAYEYMGRFYGYDVPRYIRRRKHTRKERKTYARPTKESKAKDIKRADGNKRMFIIAEKDWKLQSKKWELRKQYAKETGKKATRGRGYTQVYLKWFYNTIKTKPNTIFTEKKLV